MTVKFFWKADCPKCPAAKENVSSLEEVEYYNLDEPHGLAEAAFYSIMATPSIVISDEDGSELVAFRGDVPSREAIKKWLPQ